MSLVAAVILLALAGWAIRWYLNYCAKFAELNKIELVHQSPCFFLWAFFYQREETLTELIIGTSKVYIFLCVGEFWPFNWRFF